MQESTITPPLQSAAAGDLQAALRVSEGQLRLALSAARMGTWDWDIQTDTITSSEQVATLFGVSAGAFSAPYAAYLARVHPADRAQVARAIAAALASHESSPTVAHRVIWPDGSVHWIETHAQIYRDGEGRPVRMTGVAMDITMRTRAEAERAEAEAALETSERRFRALIEHCADAVALVDERGMIKYASPAATRMLGYDADAYIGETTCAIIHPDDQQRVADQLAALVQQPNGQFAAEVRAQHQDGSWRWFEATAVNSLADPAIAGIVVNFHDVTARRQAEAALRESEERYRAISELVSDFAFAFRFEPGGDAVLEWITDAFTRITGYTLHEMRTLADWGDCIHPEDAAVAYQHLQQLRAGSPAVGEYRITARDGRLLWLRFYSRPVWGADGQRVTRVYGGVQDITQIKRLEQQLSHAQKLEAIGRLAGGIAHDFNNLLTVILGNVELLLAASARAPSMRADAEGIRQAAGRAAALTRQLLAFSRQQVMEPRTLDLNAVVGDMTQLLRRLIGEDITLATDLAADLGQVRADPGQIEQVIMNLAVNARDAMPDGGQLTIETANVGADSPPDRAGAAGVPYVLVTVSDTGVGMDAATVARIFDPFFTTKPIGKGTGLGLATVYGIVTQSGGQISVCSEPGKGTTFRVYLPRVDAAAASASAARSQVIRLAGDATILLVEDEPALRALAARVLRGYGYRVLEAVDGPSGLAAAAQHLGRIDLLLTDVLMPGGLSGRQLAEQISARRSMIKVLYTSGYSEAMMMPTQFSAHEAFLQKPFTPDVLARKVWEILQRDR